MTTLVRNKMGWLFSTALTVAILVFPCICSDKVSAAARQRGTLTSNDIDAVIPDAEALYIDLHKARELLLHSALFAPDRRPTLRSAMLPKPSSRWTCSEHNDAWTTARRPDRLTHTPHVFDNWLVRVSGDRQDLLPAS